MRDQATLGVLGGSLISLILAGILVTWRSRAYARGAEAEVPS